MAIEDNYAPVDTIGDGVTVDFSYDWDVGIASYLRVNLQEIATGDLTLQVLGSDYTLVFDESGGIATFSTAPTSDYNVIISRDTTKDQSDKYSTAKGFQGVVQENSFDKVTNITQEICDTLIRVPKFKFGSDTENVEIDDLDPDKFLVANATGDGITNSIYGDADIPETTDDLIEGVVNLYDKIVVLNAGVGVEIISDYPVFNIKATGVVENTDKRVQVSSNDTSNGFLNTKITSDDSSVVLSITDPAGNEALDLSVSTDFFNKTIDDTEDITDTATNRFTNDIDITRLANTSGTNTGDQTSIVGITGTKTEFNTALTDGSFAFSGGAFHNGFSDFVANEHIDHSGVSITGAGDLLTGQGGDITASRVFTLDNSDIDHTKISGRGVTPHSQIDTLLHFFDGTMLESFDALVTSNGTVITLTLTPQSGSDLTMRFNGENFDFTATNTIELNAGSDSSPQFQYVYIPIATMDLQVSNSGMPDTEHIPIGWFFVPSALHTQSEGAYINQNINNEPRDENGMGHLVDIGEQARHPKGYFSGIEPNGIDQDSNISYFNYISGTESYFKSTSGEMFQFHKHPLPAIDTELSGDDFHIVNKFEDNYAEESNLANIHEDALGNSLSNRYFNIFVFEAGNKTGQYAPIFIKVPNGSYNSESSAINDTMGYDNLTMPREFALDTSVGVPVCRMTLKFTGGFNNLNHISTKDLRTAGVLGGSGVGVGASNADNLFNIFNVTDSTKIATFDASNIPTGTTNDYIFPSSAGTFALTSQSDGTIDHGADLTGLGDDDHTQYLLVNGTRAFTGTVSGVSPTLGTHLATKDYADNLVEGLSWKDTCDVASTGNITLSGEQTIDGFLTSSSRVLVKDQTDGTENGLYVSDSGSWSRSDDADTGIEIVKSTTNIINGSVNKDVMFVNSNTSITLGVTLITYKNLGSTISHNNTTGLQGGTANEFYHLTNTELTNLTSLTDNSIVNTLHRHSELVASDGSPDPALSIDDSGDATFSGDVGIGASPPVSGNRLFLDSLDNDTSMKISSRREGAVYHNSAIVFDGARGSTVDGGRSAGRAMLSLVGNSSANDASFFINANSSSLNPSDDITTLREWQGSIEVSSLGRVDFWRDGINYSRLNGNGDSWILGDLGIGSSTVNARLDIVETTVSNKILRLGRGTVLDTADVVFQTPSGSPQVIAITASGVATSAIYTDTAGARNVGDWDFNQDVYLTGGNLDVNGNVNIGSSASTGDIVSISKNQNTSTIATISNINTNANAYSEFATLSDISNLRIRSNSSARTATRYGISLGGMAEIVALSGNGLLIGTHNNNKPIILGSNGKELVRISDSASVLDVSGSGSFKDVLNVEVSTGSGNIEVIKAKSPSNTQVIIESTDATAFPMFDLIHPDQDWRIQLDGANDGFKIRDKTRNLDRFYIDTSGNVEIFKDLTVGAIFADSITTQAAGFTNVIETDALSRSYSRIKRGATILWDFRINSDDRLVFNAPTGGVLAIASVYTNTTANAANVNVDSSGISRRSTSSARYKDNIRNIEIDTSKIYDLTPRTFESKADDNTTHFGLVAEEVYKVIPELVTLNKKGQPDAVSYERVAVLLINEMKLLKNRIEELEK